MQEVKRLLEQGKHSGELIKMGFAPGTVYGVQRQFRRRAGMARTQDAKSSQLKGTPGEDVVTLAGELRYCQGQGESFQIEVERLKAAEEEACRQQHKSLLLADELRSARSELLDAESKVRQLKSENHMLIEENERLRSAFQESQIEDRRFTVCTYQRYKSCSTWLRLQPCQYQMGKEGSRVG